MLVFESKLFINIITIPGKILMLWTTGKGKSYCSFFKSLLLLFYPSAPFLEPPAPFFGTFCSFFVKISWTPIVQQKFFPGMAIFVQVFQTYQSNFPLIVIAPLKLFIPLTKNSCHSGCHDKVQFSNTSRKSYSEVRPNVKHLNVNIIKIKL